MEFDATFIQENQPVLLGVAGLLCGVALLHLVIVRMLRKRATPARRR